MVVVLWWWCCGGVAVVVVLCWDFAGSLWTLMVHCGLWWCTVDFGGSLFNAAQPIRGRSSLYRLTNKYVIQLALGHTRIIN